MARYTRSTDDNDNGYFRVDLTFAELVPLVRFGFSMPRRGVERDCLC